MIVKSYSKVNFGLHIYKNKHNKSKHKILTILCLNKGLFDIIHFEKSNSFKLEYFGNMPVPNIEDNWIYKAVIEIELLFNKKINYLVKIEKKIPDESGLGGGSSNLANVLLTLVALNNIKISKKTLAKICYKYSSDSLFFLEQKDLLKAKKYGTKFSPLSKNFVTPKFILELNNFKSNTKIIFKEFDKIGKYSHFNKNFFPKNDLLQAFIKNNKNSIKVQKNQYLSGSGSTIYKYVK